MRTASSEIAASSFSGISLLLSTFSLPSASVDPVAGAVSFPAGNDAVSIASGTAPSISLEMIACGSSASFGHVSVTIERTKAHGSAGLYSIMLATRPCVRNVYNASGRRRHHNVFSSGFHSMACIT